MSELHESPSHPLITMLTPVVFVLIWSTGFIVAKFGLPYAPPLTFLFLVDGLCCESNRRKGEIDSMARFAGGFVGCVTGG